MSTFPGYSDQDLVVRLKAGDESAFTEIYSRYSMLLYYQANQMLRDEEAAKDLVQDLFLTIWKNSDQIMADANLAGYFYVAIRNRVFKLIEKGKTRNDYLGSIAAYASEISTDTMDAIDEKELKVIIEAEIERLPPRMKEVFELSRKGHFTHQQIAERLGISDKTVKKQINKAIKVIRMRLDCTFPFEVIIAYLLLK